MDDLLALAVLAGFVLASVLLIAAGGTRLHRLWWAGSIGSGLVVAGLAASLELTVSFPAALPDQLGPALAGVLGFLAGTDIQVLIGIPMRRSGGLPAVVAGAILGPILVVGGYWLLVR